MKLKNFEIEKRVTALIPFLKHRDIIGYYAARNTRTMNDTIDEYYKFKEELIKKYGHPDKDEKGADLGTFSIRSNDKNFPKFSEELSKIANVEQDVTILKLDYSETVGLLNGEEILSIDWMLVDKRR